MCIICKYIFFFNMRNKKAQRGWAFSEIYCVDKWLSIKIQDNAMV
jgi:hypothetical protein